MVDRDDVSMAKKKNWIDGLKRFFCSKGKLKQEKREKRKRWAFSRLKSKCLPVLPGPSVLRSRSRRVAEREQSKHAVAVAVASAVAADAAVAAAHAAAEVVRLTGKPLPYHRPQEMAAVKIQTAFRGYLARSALKALKGLVKLQALIRGQAVRRQTTNTFRGLQCLMKIQSQARANRVKSLMDFQVHDFNDTKKTKNPEIAKADIQRANGRIWDTSIFSQEEIISLLNNKRDAETKRERVIEYTSSYQDRKRPTTPASSKIDHDEEEDRSWSWLDEWVGSQTLDKDILEINSTSRRDQTKEKTQKKPQLKHFGRRSFNQRTLIRDDDSISSSSFCPSYMTPTASAKARFRSLSMPKQRPSMIDSRSEYRAPCFDRLPSSSPTVAKTQKSPRTKGRTPQAKCGRSSDYLSCDSECSLLSWDR